MVSKRNLLFQVTIFRFHVKLSEGMKKRQVNFHRFKTSLPKQVSLKVNLYIYLQGNCGAHPEKKRTSNKKVSVIPPLLNKNQLNRNKKVAV